ncbi:hypothetical protein Btru_075394 [Bulinus truncatus]|nr:hypothetical protein Btru_075394 [Bulinus truncatus]
MSRWRSDITPDSMSRLNSLTKRDTTLGQIVIFLYSFMIATYLPLAVFSVLDTAIKDFAVYEHYGVLSRVMIEISYIFKNINSGSSFVIYYKMSSQYRRTFNHLLFSAKGLDDRQDGHGIKDSSNVSFLLLAISDLFSLMTGLVYDLCSNLTVHWVSEFMTEPTTITYIIIETAMILMTLFVACVSVSFIHVFVESFYLTSSFDPFLNESIVGLVLNPDYAEKNQLVGTLNTSLFIFMFIIIFVSTAVLTSQLKKKSRWRDALAGDKLTKLRGVSKRDRGCRSDSRCFIFFSDNYLLTIYIVSYTDHRGERFYSIRQVRRLLQCIDYGFISS